MSVTPEAYEPVLIWYTGETPRALTSEQKRLTKEGEQLTVLTPETPEAVQEYFFTHADRLHVVNAPVTDKELATPAAAKEQSLEITYYTEQGSPFAYPHAFSMEELGKTAVRNAISRLPRLFLISFVLFIVLAAGITALQFSAATPTDAFLAGVLVTVFLLNPVAKRLRTW